MDGCDFKYISLLAFIFSSYIVSGQTPTCDFNVNPQIPLTNCISNVVANLNLPNGNAYDFIEVYYPVQFDLSVIGTQVVNDETDLQVGSSIYTTIQVTNTNAFPITTTTATLKRIQINLPPAGNDQFDLIFNVNTCEDNFLVPGADLFDTDQYPMYFDIQAFNSNSPNNPISFQFNQQVQISGSSGLIRFSTLNSVIPSLSTSQVFNPFYATQNASSF